MTQPTDPTVPIVAAPDVSAPLIFQVQSVEKSEAPDGGSGHDWYRYVLTSRGSTITGHRRGSHQHVRDYAAHYAEQLNTRAVLCLPSWSPRGRKPARRENG